MLRTTHGSPGPLCPRFVPPGHAVGGIPPHKNRCPRARLFFGDVIFSGGPGAWHASESARTKPRLYGSWRFCGIEGLCWGGRGQPSLITDDLPGPALARRDGVATAPLPKTVKHSFQTAHIICILRKEAGACMHRAWAVQAGRHLPGTGFRSPGPPSGHDGTAFPKSRRARLCVAVRRLVSATSYPISKPLRILDDRRRFVRGPWPGEAIGPGWVPRHPRISSVVRGEGSDGISSTDCAGVPGPGWSVGLRGYGGDDPKGSPAAGKPKPVGFARDVRPILSDHCFACHGPDDKARKAGLRLDTQEGAFAELESGGRAIVPGKPGESELIARVESHDPEQQMPPKKFGKPISPEQIAVLRRWVEQGATWTKHWAFKPPQKPAPPAVKDAAWPINAVDRFILDRLEDEGLKPEPQASKTALIRRVTLDLTGLPPTPEEVDAFLADKSARAYETVVDRLLDSPRYGEHMARFWLDAARYGDTHGLHLDNYREIWPYRDWVIRAFNANMPFDRFIVEQLAGDLLPDPTLDQIVATGFNRCHVSTSEGGSIEEEVYVRNIVDQVDTNGTVFLGLTTGCARCHDHKYDPIRAKDYYQLFAFFNNIDGPAMDGNSAKWEPILPVPTRRQRDTIRSIDGQIAALKKSIADEMARAVIRLCGHGQVEDVKDEPIRLDSAGPNSSGSTMPCPPGATPQGEGPWQFVGKPDHPVLQRPALPGQQGRRAQATVLRQRRAEAGRRRGGHAVRPRVPRPETLAPRGDAPVAHGGGLVSSRVLGRERDRLRQGRHARAAGDGQAAGARPMGPAGGAGRAAQAGAGDRDPGLGVHAARRHRALGRGRDHHPHPAGRPALRLVRGVDQGPARRRCGGGLARGPQGGRAARALEVDRGAGQGAGRLLRRARRRRDRAGDPADAGQDGGGREAAEGHRRAGADDAGLPRACRRSQAGVPAEAGRVRAAGREGGPGGARVPAAAAAGRAGQPPGPGPLAGRCPDIR